MLIVPVIDLMGEVVVRGIAGRRSEYRPIESRLTHDATPRAVGQAFAQLGLTQAYVADLDAIAGAEPAWDIYEQLADCGLKLWIDAGVGDRARAETMCSFADRLPATTGIVVGLESVADPAALAQVVEVAGRERAIFSLDLKSGQPMASPGWNDLSSEAIVATAIECGIKCVIVLDLAQVGVGSGVGTLELCRRLLENHAQLQIIAGGGVRGLADLEALDAAGCMAALVASALHDGRISPAECQRWMSGEV